MEFAFTILLTMKRLKNTLIQFHNFTGTILSFMFLIWFLSGFVLIYAGFPHISKEKCFYSLDTISRKELANIKLPNSGFEGDVSIEKLNGELVYRCSKGRGNQKVYSAETHKPIDDISKEQAITLAENFSGSKVKDIEVREQLDQWMPWSYYRPMLPFYLCEMDDDKNSRVYVSSKTGTLVQETNRAGRWAARLGAIPHWIYFKSLRLNVGLWLDVVAWISGIGVLMCLSGLIVGIIRLRRRGQYSLKNLTPYKKFWYKWHHITGFVFGLFVFTFILSGMISVSDIPQWMVPVHSKTSPRKIWKQELNWSEFPSNQRLADLQSVGKGIRKIEWKRVMNQYCLWVYTDDWKNPEVYQLHTTGFQLKHGYDKKELADYMDQVYPNQQYELQLQQEFDAYYQQSQKRPKTLPVWKIDMKDEDKTSLYISPKSGELLASFNTNDRWRRWLYRSLHTFDFPFLTKYEWLRKTLLILLSIGGTAVSVTGTVLGLKWMKRRF
jgi:uncharacterized iron-regulated membrane protein